MGTDIFSQAVAVTADRVAITIVHSLWQGSLIGLAAWGSLIIMRRGSPGARHTVCLLGIIAISVSFVGTYLMTQPTGLISRSDSPQSLAKDRSQEIVVGETAATSIASSLSESARRAPIDPSPTIAKDLVKLPWRSTIGNWAPWIAGAWLLGVASFGIRSAGGWLGVRRLTRVGTFKPPPDWERRKGVIAHRMRIRGVVRLLESSLVATPSVIGWCSPVILIPTGLLGTLTSVQIEAILAHELAHIRRRDYLVNLFVIVAESVLFYHPAIWLLSRRLREEREYACDDLAVSTLDRDRIGYANALCTLEEQRSPIALAANEKPLVARIHRLLRSERPAPSNLVPFGFVITFPLVAMVGTFLWFQTESAQGQGRTTEVESKPWTSAPTFTLRHFDEPPIPTKRPFVEASGWLDHHWEMHAFDVWWEDESDSFRRASESALRMMTLPRGTTIEESEAALKKHWNDLKDIDALKVGDGELVAMFQPGAWRALLLTKPIKKIREADKTIWYDTQVIDLQVHRWGDEIHLMRAHDLSAMDLESFNRVDIPLVDPVAKRPDRMAQLSADVPAIGNLEIAFSEAIPDWETYTYKSVNPESLTPRPDSPLPEEEWPLVKIDGAVIYGPDGYAWSKKSLVASRDDQHPITRLSKFTFRMNGREIPVPEAAIANLFLPGLGATVYVSPDRQTIVIHMDCSDGAGSYWVRWLFEDGTYRFRQAERYAY